MWSNRSTSIPTIWFLLVVVVLAIATLDALAAEALAKRQSQDVFLKLAKTLSVSGDIQRRDFVWIAVSELTSAYEKVLEDSASAKTKNQEARYKLIRWRRATRAFVIELQTLLDLLRTSAEVQVYGDAAGFVTVFINNRPVVISGPKLNASQQMEHRIVEAYCELHDCEELFVTSPVQTIDSEWFSKGTWIFKQGQTPHYETSDGLVFLFSSLSGRIEKQQVCERVANELRVLVADLRDAKRAGIVIDWDLLEVQPLADSGASYVPLNKEGDYLSQNLPYLEITKLLEQDALAWVRKMVEGEKYASIIIYADRLMQSDIFERL